MAPTHPRISSRPSKAKSTDRKPPFKHTSQKFKKPSSSKDKSSTSYSSSRTTVNPLKKRRRDLQRLLSHNSEALPADVRVGYERELEACEADINTALETAARSRMIEKYHMVRFFERKKATRLLKRARQHLVQAQAAVESQPDTSVIADLEAQVHIREVDLNYTLYYPLNEAYLSLYANGGGQKSSSSVFNKTSGEVSKLGPASPDDEAEASSVGENVNREDPNWKVVEEAMVLGQGRLQMLREGKLKTSRTASNIATTGSKGMANNKSHTSQSRASATKTGVDKKNAGNGMGQNKTGRPQHKGDKRLRPDEINEAMEDDDDDGFFET